MNTQAQLREALALTGNMIAAAGYGERVGSIASLIDQEPLIAFEILCDNLHDFGCPLTQKAYALLEEVGRSFTSTSLARSPATWEMLKPQVVA